MPTVNIFSLDCDGCLFWGGVTLEAMHNGNTPLYQHITALAEHADKSTFTIGSNRQSDAIDNLNAHEHTGNNTPLATEAIQAVATKIKAPNISVDPFRLADCSNPENALPASPSEVRFPYSWNKAPYDPHKINLLYTQMHRAATLNPGATIVFHFYDDLYEQGHAALSELHDFFSTHPELMPENVQLNLWHYTQPLSGEKDRPLPSAPRRVASIQGAGKVDNTYPDTSVTIGKVQQKKGLWRSLVVAWDRGTQRASRWNHYLPAVRGRNHNTLARLRDGIQSLLGWRPSRGLLTNLVYAIPNALLYLPRGLGVGLPSVLASLPDLLSSRHGTIRMEIKETVTTAINWYARNAYEQPSIGKKFLLLFLALLLLIDTVVSFVLHAARFAIECVLSPQYRYRRSQVSQHIKVYSGSNV